MAINYKKIWDGVTVVPKTTTASSLLGELETLTSNSKIHFHNGTSNSPLVTEAHSATLTNKSMDGLQNTFTNLPAGQVVGQIPATQVGTGTVDNTEFGYLDGVTSSIQTQLNARPVSGTIVNADIAPGANIDAAKLGTGVVSNTEFNYLDGVTSAIQTQIDAKVTGPASATDNALARFDLTTGKLIQNSVVTVGDTGALAGVTTASIGQNTVSTQITTSVDRVSLTQDSTSGANVNIVSDNAPFIRLTSGTLTSIDTLSNPSQGARVTLENATGNTITINNDTGATAANRILTGTKASIPLADEATIILQYDTAETRWMVIGGTGSSSSITSESMTLSNLGISATVAANAMTIAITTSTGGTPNSANPVIVGFRSSTAGSGQYSLISTTSSISTVISSGSTAGQISGQAAYIYVYLINNAGTAEVAWSRSIYDEGSLVSTTAEGGAGAADSNSLIYSTTARSNVSVRMVGRLLNTQTTAGTWTSVPNEISIMPFVVVTPVAIYESNSGQSFTTGVTSILIYEDRVYDLYNLYNPSTGVMTVPMSGRYTISATSALTDPGSTLTIGENWQLRVFVNGSEVRRFSDSGTTASKQRYVSTVTTSLNLTTGDTVDIRGLQTSGGSLSIENTSVFNFLTITQSA